MKRLIPFLCVFAYYASPYRLAGHVLPEMIYLVAAILQLVVSRKYHLPKEYIFFMIYMWLIPPVISRIVGLPGSIFDSILPLGLLLTSLNLAILIPNVDGKIVLKYYKYLVYVAIGFFVVQEVSMTFIGYKPTLYLSFLDSYYDGANMAEFAVSRSEMDRSSSFFLEPSHYIQYIIPYVCIVISQCFQNRKITKELVILLAAVILAKTGAGYFELAVIGVYLLFIYSKMNVLKKLFVLASILGIYSIAVTYFSDNIIVAEILRRSSEFSLTVDAHGQQSGFFRIWRGYFIYAAGDPMNQIFGTALSAVEYVASKVFIAGINYEGSYMNGIQSLLVMGGVIGTLFFFLYIRKIYKDFTPTGRCVLVAMIGLFFIENMLYSPKMFLFILVASCISQLEKNQSITNQ